MADKTVQIENDSGSRERVAYDLMKYIQENSDTTVRSRQEIIDLYVDCYWATRSNRDGGR